MRPAVLRACWEAIPRLQARRDLRMVDVMTAVSPGIKRWDRKRILNRLRREAEGGRVKGKKANLEDLANLGIKVEEG